ncbi:hypothetical protein EG68_10984 [Paragonimus skrjabini miyazakii]|uniref:DUF4806 domain-containing protein n=1 Tax=Paragonimus skrjabini miyazakii TaxID=59628 RepID=A0A8S9YEU4_9TREM|nr:hypothetical protein EG68_10984 [Paragonimus skrjabini miyazakii]
MSDEHHDNAEWFSEMLASRSTINRNVRRSLAEFHRNVQDSLVNVDVSQRSSSTLRCYALAPSTRRIPAAVFHGPVASSVGIHAAHCPISPTGLPVPAVTPIRPRSVTPTLSSRPLFNTSLPNIRPLTPKSPPTSLQPSASLSVAPLSASSPQSESAISSQLTRLIRMFQGFAAKQEELIRDVAIVKECLNQRRLFPDVDAQGEAVREIRSHALPVNSVSSFRELEANLQRQPFRTVVMDHLKAMSASSARLLLRRCMREAIGSQLAVEMTYAGGKNKLAFKDTILRRVIEETVLSQEVSSETGRDDVNRWMRCWFYDARDRGGKCRLRKPKTPLQERESHAEV